MSLKYKTISAESGEELSELVDTELADGWTLHGDISIVGCLHSAIVFTQVMVNVEEG